jgi:6-pyruvoyltetrahydropterin/6-carboxytetrahydropterin synthase
MYHVRVEFIFACGHRLLGHRGQCAFPHGHTYKAEVWIGARCLDDMGFVVDFAHIKDALGSWIEENWDHAFLANSLDMEILEALGRVKGSRLFLFPEANPSAETMAHKLYQQVHTLCGTRPIRVRVWESPTQYAEYFEADSHH